MLYKLTATMQTLVLGEPAPDGDYSDTLWIGADSPELAKLTAIATWPDIKAIHSITELPED